MKAYYLPDQMREELRHPLGMLIKEEPPGSIQRLQRLIKLYSPPVIIAVGDVVAKNLISAGVETKIAIVDGNQ